MWVEILDFIGLFIAPVLLIIIAIGWICIAIWLFMDGDRDFIVLGIILLLLSAVIIIVLLACFESRGLI